jgi:hypothetical protein
MAQWAEAMFYKPEDREPHCGPGVNSASKINEY